MPDGKIKEARKVDKHPLPFSIRKAEEKAAATHSSSSKSKSRLSGVNNNNRKRQESDVRAFASGMDWNKLPKEILATLGIEPVPNNEPSCKKSTPPLALRIKTSPEDRASVRSPHSALSDDNREVDDTKPRRVSFKDTPEKIPHAVKVEETLEEDPFKVN